MEKRKHLTAIIIVLTISLLISIIPVIIASFYSHPVLDDFGFSEKIHHAVIDGKGISGVLSASFQKVKDIYVSWQGTYSAVFIFTLQPAAFSDNLYFLTSIVMLAALIGSTILFMSALFNACEFDKRFGIISSLVILILSIHFVPYKDESFFWWNGCSYYALFYAFSLLFFSFLIRLYSAKKHTRRIILFILSLLFAVIIGGGNYSTALLTAVMMLVVIGIVLKTNKRLLPYYLAIFIVLLAGFAFSIAAPGNAVRAAAVTGDSPIRAILKSIFYAVYHIAQWTGLSQIAGFIIIAVIGYTITKGTKYKFRLPLAVLVISVLIFATQLTPPLYAMSNIGSGRQINIYYYSYYLLISVNIIYFCGWLNRRKIVSINTSCIKRGFVISSFAIVLCIFICGCLNFGLTNTTFGSTLSALRKGTPQAYSIQYNEIINEINEGNTVVSEIKTVPSFFKRFGISEDPEFWANRQIARYYRVDSITLDTDSNSDN